MGNLIRSISSFIGGRADVASARSEAQATAAHPSTPVEPQQIEPDRASARDLPLVAYATPLEETSPSRPRRSRAVSLLRSASATAVTSRTVPTLPSVVTRQPAHLAGTHLTETERIRLQVMQAQIQLSVLRLYEGPIDGNMSPATAQGVRYFQTLKGLRATGTLAAGTLAALGVPLIA
jgi:Putative peptidoglycan binding domain